MLGACGTISNHTICTGHRWNLSVNMIAMVECKTAVSPVCEHWRYCSLVLRHWCALGFPQEMCTCIWWNGSFMMLEMAVGCKVIVCHLLMHWAWHVITVKTESFHNANFVITATISDDKVGIMTILTFQWYFCSKYSNCWSSFILS